MTSRSKRKADVPLDREIGQTGGLKELAVSSGRRLKKKRATSPVGQLASFFGIPLDVGLHASVISVTVLLTGMRT